MCLERKQDRGMKNEMKDGKTSVLLRLISFFCRAAGEKEREDRRVRNHGTSHSERGTKTILINTYLRSTTGKTKKLVSAVKRFAAAMYHAIL